MKYKRLYNFFYACSKVGHELRRCKDVSTNIRKVIGKFYITLIAKVRKLEHVSHLVILHKLAFANLLIKLFQKLYMPKMMRPLLEILYFSEPECFHFRQDNS